MQYFGIVSLLCFRYHPYLRVFGSSSPADPFLTYSRWVAIGPARGCYRAVSFLLRSTGSCVLSCWCDRIQGGASLWLSWVARISSASVEQLSWDDWIWCCWVLVVLNVGGSVLLSSGAAALFVVDCCCALVAVEWIRVAKMD
ncbi:hypothetical protein ACOSP7_031974 [Xanthoceras sorbifolium]